MYQIKIEGVDKIFEVDANNSKQAIQFFIENNVTVNNPLKASEINKAIQQIRGKLKAEGIDVKDYNKAIKVLNRCVAPVYCIKIYKDYIFSYFTALARIEGMEKEL